MSAFVLDASVAADWLLEDEADPIAATALGLLKREGAIVPDLWHFEMRNTLLVAERRGRLASDEVEERVDAIKTLPVSTDEEPNLDAAFALAREYGLSFYDAIYLELATRREVEIATLDAALVRTAVAEGLSVVGYD